MTTIKNVRDAFVEEFEPDWAGTRIIDGLFAEGREELGEGDLDNSVIAGFIEQHRQTFCAVLSKGWQRILRPRFKPSGWSGGFVGKGARGLMANKQFAKKLNKALAGIGVEVDEQV